MTLEDILDAPRDQEIIIEGEDLITIAHSLSKNKALPKSIIDGILSAKRIRVLPVGHEITRLEDGVKDIGRAAGRQWVYE